MVRDRVLQLVAELFVAIQKQKKGGAGRAAGTLRPEVQGHRSVGGGKGFWVLMDRRYGGKRLLI